MNTRLRMLYIDARKRQRLKNITRTYVSPAGYGCTLSGIYQVPTVSKPFLQYIFIFKFAVSKKKNNNKLEIEL